MTAAIFMSRAVCLTPAKRALLKASVYLRNPMVNQSKEANKARSSFRKTSPTLKERLFAPEQGTAFSLSKGALLAASALGIGSLCYFGLGLASEPGVIEESMLWPQYVKDRIKSTYMYFGGSLAITAASAYAVFQSPKLLSLMMRNSWLAFGATFAAMIGSGMVVHSIPYTESFGRKQVAWIAHSGIMGAVIAPLCFMGGPLILRAAMYTAGVVGGLSAVAVCAPSEKFLYMGGPLACGLGVIFASSLASLFLSPATALGAGLYSISIYGGLVIFSGLLLYDTHLIVRMAELHPVNGVRSYDPINVSISIYLDTLNIFVRIAMLLARGGDSGKK